MNICPRCHRPIEGEEAYVCCAGVELRWRCAGCGKVSEGFAFPYGMCPHCKGRLELLERGPIEDQWALDAIRKAFEIEIGGLAFYERAARDAAEPVLRDLFGRLAEMEKEHMATLSGRYHVDVSEASEGFKTERAAVYAGIPNDPQDPANLFRIAIAFEQRAVKYFSEKGASCAPGSMEQQLYKELAAEEREHVDILTTEYNRFKAGKPGML